MISGDLQPINANHWINSGWNSFYPTPNCKIPNPLFVTQKHGKLQNSRVRENSWCAKSNQSATINSQWHHLLRHKILINRELTNRIALNYDSFFGLKPPLLSHAITIYSTLQFTAHQFQIQSWAFITNKTNQTTHTFSNGGRFKVPARRWLLEFWTLGESQPVAWA